MPEPIHTPEDFGRQLAYAINEIRAIGTDAELPTDRKTCAARLRALGDYLNNPPPGGRFYGDPPERIGQTIIDAVTIPIQA